MKYILNNVENISVFSFIESLRYDNSELNEQIKRVRLLNYLLLNKKHYPNE